MCLKSDWGLCVEFGRFDGTRYVIDWLYNLTILWCRIHTSLFFVEALGI